MIDLILRLSDHDERALEALLLRRRWWADHLMRAVTHLGGATVTIGVVLGLLAGFEADHVLGRAGAVAAFALACSHALVQLIKRTVSRPRPRLPVGLESLVRAPDRFSFPSGHAAASLAVALPLALALGGLAGWGMIGLYPTGMLVTWGVIGLVEMVLAALLGGWIYREEEPAG